MNMFPRRGATAIEFALTLPLFVGLVAAIFEYGWMFYMRSTVIHAVRDGCRAGAVIPWNESPSPNEVAQARMTDFLAGYSIDCRGDTERCGIAITSEGESPYETMNCELTIAYEPMIGVLPVPERLGAGSVVMYEIQQ